MRCFICHQAVESPGINIQGISICPICERTILKLNVDDSGYDLVVNKIKIIWKHLLCGEEHSTP